MALRRRSSRIAGPSTPARNHAVPVTSKLSSLLERDESPQAAQPTIDALISSPIVPNTAPNPARFHSLTSTMVTPQHGSRNLPPRSEMHPSKVQLSTMKPSQIAKPSGSHPSNGLTRSPSKIAMATPSKRPSTAPRTSSTFDFSFEKPDSDLSSEARKIMDSVREEAAKIKAQMMAEQKKQQTSDEEAKQLFGVGGRQIKKAKGRSGRFSDLHRQEFKKMDSIANHASTWKNKLQGTSETSLKRSSSKAALDQAPSNLPRSKSSNMLNETGNDRLENTSPSKRARRDLDEDTSADRPSSRDDTMTIKIPLNGLPSAVSTPTKSSLARSASVKSLKTSMIPSLTRSQSTHTLASPTAPQTEPGNKRLGSWAKLGGNMKSILHRAQPKFSNDPVKVAAGTHLPVTQAQANIDKDLPSLPDTPTIKHVDFSNSTKSRHELAASPSKIPTSKSMQSLPRPQSSSSQTALSSLERDSEQIHYPDLTASPLITSTRGKSSKASKISTPTAATPTPSAGPGDFTFRADTSISFKDTPAASNEDNNPAGFTSPNGTRTIRPVRPSGVPTCTMPGAYDSTPFVAAPAITHGLSNKKRKHAEPDTESDVENINPQGMDLDKANSDNEDDGRAKKKSRTGSEAPEMMWGTPQKKGRMMTKMGSPAKRRMTGAGATTPKKGGLSLARLNMLARPKERR